jgi:hypothetical protein
MIDMTKDCRFVQVASNCSVASARGQFKYVHPIVTVNSSVTSRMGPVVTFKLRQQKSCRCARSHIKQCSPSWQHKSWATKVASARLA